MTTLTCTKCSGSGLKRNRLCDNCSGWGVTQEEIKPPSTRGPRIRGAQQAKKSFIHTNALRKNSSQHFKKGQRVRHPRFGIGNITFADNEEVQVTFEWCGNKTFSSIRASALLKRLFNPWADHELFDGDKGTKKLPSEVISDKSEDDEYGCDDEDGDEDDRFYERKPEMGFYDAVYCPYCGSSRGRTGRSRSTGRSKFRCADCGETFSGSNLD